MLYADEPISAFDVSVQAQVLNLLMDVRSQLGLTRVMVSHDLAVVSLCEQVIVMQDGFIVETGRTSDVLANPGEASHGLSRHSGKDGEPLSTWWMETRFSHA